MLTGHCTAYNGIGMATFNGIGMATFNVQRHLPSKRFLVKDIGNPSHVHLKKEYFFGEGKKD
jgi:hypothetical protein